LVIPNFARRRAFLEEEHHGLHSRALECAAGAVEDGIEVAAFQQKLAQAHGCVVGIRQKGILDNHAAAAPGLEHFDEVLEEEEGGLAGADGEVLLHFLALLAAEGRIGHYDLDAVFLLNVGKVFGERIGVDYVGRLDAMQDHVHDRDDVREGLLLLAVESALLKDAVLRGSALGVGVLQVIERLAQEARRADRAIVDALSDSGFHDLDDGADQRTRSVILAAVAPGVAHIFDLGLVEVRELVLLGL